MLVRENGGSRGARPPPVDPECSSTTCPSCVGLPVHEQYACAEGFREAVFAPGDVVTSRGRSRLLTSSRRARASAPCVCRARASSSPWRSTARGATSGSWSSSGTCAGAGGRQKKSERSAAEGCLTAGERRRHAARDGRRRLFDARPSRVRGSRSSWWRARSSGGAWCERRGPTSTAFIRGVRLVIVRSPSSGKVSFALKIFQRRLFHVMCSEVSRVSFRGRRASSACTTSS